MSTLRHFKLMAKSLLLKYKNKSAEPAGARGEGAGSEVRYCFFALFLSAIIRIDLHKGRECVLFHIIAAVGEHNV